MTTTIQDLDCRITALERGQWAKEWRPAETAPFDEEILLCHDNGKAGLFQGTGFRASNGWFESDAKTLMKLEPTHWLPVPALPRATERHMLDG